ncbi:hypothetical protein ACWGSK_10275 [Nocardiopsis sp. NPDC055551]
MNPPPPEMPDSANTVRALMFVGGTVGLLLGLLLWCFALMPLLSEELARSILEGEDKTLMSTSDAVARFGLFGAIPFAYGVLSLLFASRMRDRDTATLWTVVGFQATAALVLIVSIGTGEVLPVVPLLFTIGMIGLMFTSRSRAYYGL